MNEAKSISGQAAEQIDAAIEGVRWARNHLRDRGVSQKLREVQLSLSSIALALQHEMDGESYKAEAAISHADWSDQDSAAFWAQFRIYQEGC